MIITNRGDKRGLNFRVTGVHKPLAAGSAVVHAGNRVVLDDDEGSWIQNKKTGSVVDLYEKNGVYVFDAWVLPSVDKKEKVQDMATLKNEDSGQPAFSRQVRWP